jgi:hypothetical protein
VQFFEIKRKARQAVLLHLRDDSATETPAQMSLPKGVSTLTVAPSLSRTDSPGFAVSQSREYFQSFSVRCRGLFGCWTRHVFQLCPLFQMLMAKKMDEGLDDRGTFVKESKLRVSKELHLAVEKASSMADVLKSPTPMDESHGWSFLSVMPQRDLWFLPGQHGLCFPQAPVVGSPLADLTPTHAVTGTPSPPSHRSGKLSVRASSTLAPISRAVSPITSPTTATVPITHFPDVSTPFLAEAADVVMKSAETTHLTIDTSKQAHPPRPLKAKSLSVAHPSKDGFSSPKYTALAAVLMDFNVKPGKSGAVTPVVNSMAPAMPERKSRRSVPPRPRPTSAANKYQLPPSHSSESPDVSPAASPLIAPLPSSVPVISQAWVRKSTSAGLRTGQDSPGRASVGSGESISTVHGVSSGTSREDKQRAAGGVRSRSNTPKHSDLPKISSSQGIRPPSAVKSRKV